MSPGEDDPRRVGEDLLLMAAYLLSSGRGLLEEPPHYAPLRCIDAARRILPLAARLGADSPGVQGLRAELDDVICGAMTDRDLAALLDHLCQRAASVLEEPDVISE